MRYMLLPLWIKGLSPSVQQVRHGLHFANTTHTVTSKWGTHVCRQYESRWGLGRLGFQPRWEVWPLYLIIENTWNKKKKKMPINCPVCTLGLFCVSVCALLSFIEISHQRAADFKPKSWHHENVFFPNSFKLKRWLRAGALWGLATSNDLDLELGKRRPSGLATFQDLAPPGCWCHLSHLARTTLVRGPLVDWMAVRVYCLLCLARGGGSVLIVGCFVGSQFQGRLPASGVDIKQTPSNIGIEKMFDDYVRARICQNWKFWIVSLKLNCFICFKPQFEM